MCVCWRVCRCLLRKGVFDNERAKQRAISVEQPTAVQTEKAICNKTQRNQLDEHDHCDTRQAYGKVRLFNSSENKQHGVTQYKANTARAQHGHKTIKKGKPTKELESRGKVTHKREHHKMIKHIRQTVETHTYGEEQAMQGQAYRQQQRLQQTQTTHQTEHTRKGANHKQQHALWTTKEREHDTKTHSDLEHLTTNLKQKQRI